MNRSFYLVEKRYEFELIDIQEILHLLSLEATQNLPIKLADEIYLFLLEIDSFCAHRLLNVRNQGPKEIDTTLIIEIFVPHMPVAHQFSPFLRLCLLNKDDSLYSSSLSRAQSRHVVISNRSLFLG